MRKPYGKIRNPRLEKEQRRKLSIRKKVSGTAEAPRVCVTKSSKHLRVQIVDDVKGVTLFSVQTFGKNRVAEKANAEGAKKLGLEVSARLKKLNVSKAVFDRSGKQYTGVISVVADSIRENGIQV